MEDKLSNRPTSVAGESGSRSTATTSDEVKGEEEKKKNPRGLTGFFLSYRHISQPEATLSTRKRRDISIKKYIGANSALDFSQNVSLS